MLKVLRGRYLCSTCEAFFVYVVGDVSGGERWSSMREHIFTKVKYRLGCVLNWFFRRRIFNCPVLFLSCCLSCVNQKIRRVKVEWIR